MGRTNHTDYCDKMKRNDALGVVPRFYTWYSVLRISGSIVFDNEKKFVLDIRVKSSSDCKSLMIPKFGVLK